MDCHSEIPDDLAQCQRLLQDAQLRTGELQRVLDETAASYEELRQEHAAVLEQLAWYKRWVHGRRRERIVEGEGQQHLFDLAPEGAPEDPSHSEPQEPQQEVAAHSRRRRSRQLDLSRLPHHRHELDLPEAEKTCSCCGRAKDRIGEDVTKILEYEPSKLEVHEHVRPKYACRYCKDGVSSPPPPPRPIARGIAGPGLISQLVVSKFGDHLPLYRLEDIFVRHGIHLPRSTLGDWVRAAGELLQPLYDFTMSRSRDGPQRFLQNFRGYLHADAYAGYDAIYLGSGNEIVEVACWAHARRKFFDSRKNYPREAHHVLEWIRQLYDIEGNRSRPGEQ